MKNNYYVEVTQNISRTITVPVPGLNLTEDQVKEVIGKMNLDFLFEPESGCETVYGDILEERSKSYSFSLDEYELDPDWDEDHLPNNRKYYAELDGGERLNVDFYEEFEKKCDELNFVGEGL